MAVSANKSHFQSTKTIPVDYNNQDNIYNSSCSKIGYNDLVEITLLIIIKRAALMLIFYGMHKLLMLIAKNLVKINKKEHLLC